MACWTVVIFSASSSGISVSNSSSSAITSSTVSSESAPRSSTKEDSLVTSSSLTPSCSATIAFTRCSILLIVVGILWKEMNPNPARPEGRPTWGAYSMLRLPGGPIGAKLQSDHVHTAVYVQRFAGDIGGFGRCEESDRVCDVLRRAQSTERHLTEQRRFLRVAQRLGHVGDDEAGRDHVDRDVARAHLARQA